MTGCNKCGEPTKVVKSTGGTTSGEFTEIVECVNGHTGRVEGKAENHPKAWTRTGEVHQS